MVKLRYSLYGFILCLALWLYPFFSYSAQGCGSFKDNLNAALNAGFAPLFTAVTDRALPIMVVINQAGDWVILGIDEDQNACALAKGTDIKLMFERGA